MINDTYIFARRPGIYDFIDLQGKIIASYDDYDKMNPFFAKGKYLSLVAKNGKEGLIDFLSGEVIVPLEYERTSRYDNAGDADLFFRKGEQVYSFGMDGKLVKLPYTERDDFNYGIAKVGYYDGDETKYGLINLSRKLVVPCVYDHIDYFSGGMAIVRKNEKCGFMDYSGKLVIPTIYDEVKSFETGGYSVKVVKNGETFEIDRTGKKIEWDDDWDY